MGDFRGCRTQNHAALLFLDKYYDVQLVRIPMRIKLQSRIAREGRRRFVRIGYTDFA
jgi:hypothetical protein